MRILLQAAILATSLLSPQVAAAQTCTSLKDVLAELDGYHEKHVELTAKSLLGVDGQGLGAIIVSTFGKTIVIGFEVNGCVSDPIPVAVLLKADVHS